MKYVYKYCRQTSYVSNDDVRRYGDHDNEKGHFNERKSFFERDFKKDRLNIQQNLYTIS